MNVADVIIRVRRTFGDEAAVQVTDDDIVRWINDGQVEIVKNNDSALQTTSFIDIVQGISQYDLPADLLVLRSLRYKFLGMSSFVRLRYKSMQQFDEEMDGWDGTSFNESKPAIFTMYENKFIVFPTPEESNVGGFKLLYNRKPVDVATSTDDLALPLIYHNTIVKYALMQASLLDEDHEPGMMYKSDFNADMALLQQNETRDPVATYPVITVLADDL